MGFNVLTMTNFVTVRSPEIPEEMRATIEGWDGYWEYAERLSECSKFIETMGCGIHHYNATKNSKPEVSNKQYSAAVAEWVDGDALSAHYAFGCDVFCTNDRGSNAGSGSIFHPNNLPRCREHFKIVVLSPEELSAANIEDGLS